MFFNKNINQIYFKIMSKKDKTEEIQSRREFFKSAAKKALPILGAIALTSSISLLTNSCGSYNCGDSCYGSCYTSCPGTCAKTMTVGRD